MTRKRPSCPTCEFPGTSDWPLWLTENRTWALFWSIQVNVWLLRTITYFAQKQTIWSYDEQTTFQAMKWFLDHFYVCIKLHQDGHAGTCFNSNMFIIFINWLFQSLQKGHFHWCSHSDVTLYPCFVHEYGSFFGVERSITHNMNPGLRCQRENKFGAVLDCYLTNTCFTEQFTLKINDPMAVFQRHRVNFSTVDCPKNDTGSTVQMGWFSFHHSVSHISSWALLFPIQSP